LLPPLQLVLTDAVLPHERQKAEFTLQRLHLGDDERVIRQRQQWYQLYLDGLEKKTPLITGAIRKQQGYSKRRLEF